MICKNCNTNNPEDALFCRNCGKGLSEDTNKSLDFLPHTNSVHNKMISKDSNKSLVFVVIFILIVTFIMILSISKCSNPVLIPAPQADTTVVAVDTIATDSTAVAIDTTALVNNVSATKISASEENIAFTSNGGTKIIEINTDGSNWNISVGTANWISTSCNGNTITLNCQANTGVARTDYFEVKADNQTLRIHISQSSCVKSPSATINRVWVDHNTFQDNIKGMSIHVNFDIYNQLNKKCQCNAYFYYSDGTQLKDSNGSYNTTDGQVCAPKRITPNYVNCSYSDLDIFIPNSELHLESSDPVKLKFRITIFDENSNSLVQSDYTNFNYN